MYLKIHKYLGGMRKGEHSTSKYCFEKLVFKICNIFMSNEYVTLQCTYHTLKYQESEKSQIWLCDPIDPFSHTPSYI